MKNLKVLYVSIFMLGAMSASALAQNRTLFDRLGGKDAITAVVDEFATRCLADTRINKKFAQSDPARLKAMLVDQICSATGGPCQYTGLDMRTAHKKMGVTAGEFNALVEDLVGALDKFNVPEAEKTELLGMLAPMKTDIVEDQSPATGTPLGKGFKPAPSMKAAKMAEDLKAKKMEQEKLKAEADAMKKEQKAAKDAQKPAKDSKDSKKKP